MGALLSRIFSLLFLICIGVSSSAQSLQKPIRILTTKDGLPQSFISGLLQDKEGFIWIGTRNGLARYDGIRFRLFQHDTQDTAGLSSNLIISVKTDRHNMLWVEHESQDIDCMDPVTEKIEKITARPLFRAKPIEFMRRGWMADVTGNLWFIQRTKGLYRYDWKNDSVTHFSKKAGTLPSDTLFGLIEDGGKSWILSQHALTIFDSATGKFSHTSIPFITDFNTSDIREIVTIHKRTNGEIMFGDRRHLYFFNPAARTFRQVPLPVYGDLGIRWIQPGPGGKDYFEMKGIVYVYEDNKGILPVAEIGISTYRDATSFLVDRSGVIWLGTNAAGIHQIDLTTPFFESHPPLNAFHYDLLNSKFGIGLDKFANWPLSDKEFSLSSYLFRSTYAPDGRLFIALRDRVGYYDQQKNKIISLPPVPGISDPTNITWGLRGIQFSARGDLWVMADRDFLFSFDSVKQRWVTFIDITWLRDANFGFTLNDLLADEEKLWITTGSGEGLLSIDIRTKVVQQLNHKTLPGLFPTDRMLKLQRDPAREDLLWIGTYEGLVCLNKKKLTTEVFSIKQGLPDNTVYSIEADNAGYLWLSTNKGLCRFHPVTHELLLFQSVDGLPGEEFNRFHHLKLPDGRLAFGGTEGWAIFDPTMIKNDIYQPAVAFTSLKINNITVTDNPEKHFLPASLNHLSLLTLPYDQNTLTFEFAGLEFNKPQKLRYRYKLGSYDNEWIVTNTPAVNYTKLPPGHYTLSINASNTTGQWSSMIRTLSIIIKPPFWLTWWAYTLYALIVAGLFGMYVRYRVNRERMRQKFFLREREAIQLKAVDELKTRFFSNITHEFRTPLTLILTPAQRLKPTLRDKDQFRWLSAIERNAHQLLRLINQLLDFSKLESGTLLLNETRGNLRDFIDELLRSFYEEAEANGISLTFNNQSPGDYWFDADKLEQVVRNLVANALKFTPKGGKVEVIIKTASHPQGENNINSTSSVPIGVSLTVRDTGIGIPEDQLPYVFNRFYQVDNISAGRSGASHPKGSGIGLSLVKEMVELQGGNIEVTSITADESAWHTIFTVWLPYRPAITGDTASIATKAVNQYPAPEYDQFIPMEIEPLARAGEAGATSVLLVEDNAELAEFIADSLPVSYHITRAANGAEGLEKAFDLMPELVISDVLMPVMDGYEFCNKLKSDDRTNHIPVIMLTAKASFENRIQGLTLGADDYLTKPFHIQELQLRAHNLLDRQRILREKLRLELEQPGAPQTEIKSPAVFQNPFIQKLYDIIEERLDDSLFGVEELAGGVGMSRTTLYRKLKAVSDLPASDIIRNYRLKRAVQFLKEGSNSSETAYKTGFDSPAYFSKCFKDFYQMTPLEFVQKN